MRAAQRESRADPDMEEGQHRTGAGRAATAAQFPAENRRRWQSAYHGCAATGRGTVSVHCAEYDGDPGECYGQADCSRYLRGCGNEFVTLWMGWETGRHYGW